MGYLDLLGILQTRSCRSFVLFGATAGGSVRHVAVVLQRNHFMRQWTDRQVVQEKTLYAALSLKSHYSLPSFSNLAMGCSMHLVGVLQVRRLDCFVHFG
jgi:hypothetical protein